MRVLVVEDEPTLAAQLATALSEAGYAVDSASNGSMPIFSAMMKTSPGSVILDLGLPQMDA